MVCLYVAQPWCLASDCSLTAQAGAMLAATVTPSISQDHHQQPGCRQEKPRQQYPSTNIITDGRFGQGQGDSEIFAKVSCFLYSVPVNCEERVPLYSVTCEGAEDEELAQVVRVAAP